MKSNERVLTLRQNLIEWFKKYEYILVPFFRFLLSLCVLNMLIQSTEYEGILNNIVIKLVLAVMGAFVPVEALVVGLILISTVLIASSNVILGIIVFIILCLIYILYGRLFPKESLLIVAMVLALSLKIEVLVLLVAALFGGYMGIVAIIIGTVIWYTMPVLMQNLPAMPVDKSAILDMVNQLLNIDYTAMLINREMLIMCVIILIVFSCVYLIRKSGVDYGPYIAIVVGVIMNILGFILAKVFFCDLNIDLFNIVLCSIAMAIVAVIMQFLNVVMDYQRAEIVDFEDEDNYYHVKIVPKIQLAAKKRTVKHVYANQKEMKREPAKSQQPPMSESERIKKMIMEDDDFRY